MVAVRFEHITKSYGTAKAVDDLSLEIVDGALHFLLGPSGCGKTTTLRMLAGLEPPTSGRILFDDRDVTTMPAAERGIGMVFQSYALWPHMTVRANVEYGLKLRQLKGQDLRARLEQALSLTQLDAYAERYPGQLSGGQQQRVALARALAIRPTVLLLDEPLSNLDAKLRLEMRDNLVRIHEETKLTTVYVTHDQKEALSMGTHVSVLRGGKLLQNDPPRRLYHAPKTAFLASFIGETNLVPGHYVGTEHGVHAVATDFGVLHIARLGDFTPAQGQAVLVSMRPESIRPSTRAAKDDSMVNNLSLTIAQRTYLGDSEQLVLRGKGEKTLRATIFDPPEDQVPAHEQTPRAYAVSAADLLVLPVEDDLSSGT